MRNSALARRWIGGRLSTLALAAPHYAAHGHLLRRRTVRRYLRGARPPALQLGSGFNRLPGWLNSDIRRGDIYLDVTRRLPLPTGSFEFVFAEHLIEHVEREQALGLLREVHRVLRPAGVVRITTPDLRKIIALYEDRNPVISLADYCAFLQTITHGKPHASAAQAFNTFMHEWGHRFIYDEEELTATLLAAGFVDVVRHAPGESAHDRLRAIESHGPEWENAAEAMCVEARRP